MRLTISELADAVDRKEGFVRQHIHRKHLLTKKDGRNVSVELEEAMRWASERGLPFNLPAFTSVTTNAMKDRTARMTVLAWHKPGCAASQSIHPHSSPTEGCAGALG